MTMKKFFLSIKLACIPDYYPGYIKWMTMQISKTCESCFNRIAYGEGVGAFWQAPSDGQPQL